MFSLRSLFTGRFRFAFLGLLALLAVIGALWFSMFAARTFHQPAPAGPSSAIESGVIPPDDDAAPLVEAEDDNLEWQDVPLEIIPITETEHQANLAVATAWVNLAFDWQPQDIQPTHPWDLRDGNLGNNPFAAAVARANEELLAEGGRGEVEGTEIRFTSDHALRRGFLPVTELIDFTDLEITLPGVVEFQFRTEFNPISPDNTFCVEPLVGFLTVMLDGERVSSARLWGVNHELGWCDTIGYPSRGM
jgi:hypothetical protein